MKGQAWLEVNHPKEKRKNISKLDISNKRLEGELNLSEFVGLEKIDCHGNKLENLNVKNCVELKELDCSDNKLGSLDLSNCIRLEELNCSFNNLTDLDFPSVGLKKLKRFSCGDNFLTNLNFLSSLNTNELFSLNIANNNFPKQDLSIFACLVNLKLLWVGNDDEEKVEKNIYNRFYGSLELLRELKQLESLNISNTDVDSGLEYLPDSIKYVYCLFKQRPESKVKKIFEQLYDEDEGKFSIKRTYKTTHVKRSIFLVGCTGSGKSTLADVLTNTHKFTESEYSVSRTKDIQIEEFNYEGTNYYVMDTPGVDNTQLSRDKVFLETKEGIDSVKEEMSQIFFLVKDGNFSEGEKEIFKLLEIVLGNDATNYVTIIRTNFPSFEDEERCKKDREFLIEEIKKVSNLVILGDKIIHVDNPSLNHSRHDFVRLSKESREASRAKLLEHLQKKCQKSCKLDSAKIDSYIEEKKEDIVDNSNIEVKPKFCQFL